MQPDGLGASFSRSIFSFAIRRWMGRRRDWSSWFTLKRRSLGFTVLVFFGKDKRGSQESRARNHLVRRRTCSVLALNLLHFGGRLIVKRPSPFGR